MPADEPHEISSGLAIHEALATLMALLCACIWLVTERGAFWPAWVWFALAVTVAVHLLVLRVARAGRARRWRELRRWGLGLCAAIVLAVWLLSGMQSDWVVWPLFLLAVVVAADVLVERRGRLPWARAQQLAERVETLTRTRRGALDVQAEQLRRIERDLHDGAQARLVALTMQLGRAEARLEDDPEAAALVRGAREEAAAAIAELRDLARGIAPPVLADRGLPAAVEALARRQATPVAVHASDLGPRPAPVVEAAAYFVVAEALTNVAKHAGGASATVTLQRDGATLRIGITDTGPGGATAAGSGLTGLRHRVEALDGTLRVASPRGGPTTIVAELPCGS